MLRLIGGSCVEFLGDNTKNGKGPGTPSRAEVFHSLYFNRDGNRNGIANGNSLPSEDEINEVVKNFQLLNNVIEHD